MWMKNVSDMMYRVYIPCTSCHWHSSSNCLWRWNR